MQAAERSQLRAIIYPFIMRPSSLGGGRILRRTLSVCLSVCPSVCLSVRPVIVYIRTVLRANIQNRKTSVFAYGPASRMYTFRHAQRAAYRTAISAAQTCFRRLLSSDDFNRRRGVAMSIAVSISAVQSHTPDVNADELSNSRRSPSLISTSVGADRPCCRRSNGSLHSFSLTGTIFSLIPSHFARIQSSRSQYFTSTNHLSCGLISIFY